MICQKCNTSFPIKIWIDGKQKNLQKRKFCLECSPFGTHNTRNLCNPKSLDTKTCPICSKLYSHKGTKCNSCRVSEWRRNKKKQLVEYKGGKCQICGYDRCIDNLVFHHLDPSKKEFQISGVTKSFNNLKTEVDKCILLCHICHGEVHAGLISIPEWDNSSPSPC